MLAVWVSLVIGLFVLSIMAVPNSWDAMVYHMSRVAHWTHNRNVAYFATPITRELWAMPLAIVAVVFALLQFIAFGQQARAAVAHSRPSGLGACAGLLQRVFIGIIMVWTVLAAASL